MRFRKFLAFSATIVLVIALLAGCGANTSDMLYDGSYKNAEGIYDSSAEVGSSITPSDSGQIDGAAEQKLIKTVNLSAETEDLTGLLDDLSQQVKNLGGYIESRTVYNGSAYSGSRSRSADLTIRIPAENLDGFVSQVQGMSNIISSNEEVDDVTLTYVAVESRVEALEAEQARLLELMDMAQTMSELLEVEARLTEVVGELESVTSQLRVLQNRVNYATVELSVREVQTLTVVEEESVWQRMARGFLENLENLGDGIVEFAIFLVASLPYLVPLGAIAAVVILLLRRRRKRKKAAKAAPSPAEPEVKE